jgi:protein-S-isoprenylcysteine O-methyltransferase Ste14
METAVQAREGTPLVSESHPSARTRLDSVALGRAASNLGVATIFFLALAFHSRQYGGLSDLIWMIGAALMGVLSLIRVPPKAALVTFNSIVATTFMMVTPLLMKAQPHLGASRVITDCGIAVEFLGMIISEGARIYLGRRFGLLPANRGVVSTGPFRIVRHPIYLGWFILSIGFVMAYPTALNLSLLIITLPFMMWRIDLEEQLLRQDPAYLAYCGSTRYRVLPLVY